MARNRNHIRGGETRAPDGIGQGTLLSKDATAKIIIIGIVVVENGSCQGDITSNVDQVDTSIAVEVVLAVGINDLISLIDQQADVAVVRADGIRKADGSRFPDIDTKRGSATHHNIVESDVTATLRNDHADTRRVKDGEVGKRQIRSTGICTNT